MKKLHAILLMPALVFATAAFSQTPEERQQITRNYDQAKLAALEAELRQDFETNQREARALAQQNGWPLEMETPDGGQALLVGLFPDGSPKYYQTYNREGAITTRTNLVHTGGGAGLDLNGENMVGGIWDGGRVRATHNLLENRATQMDDPSSISTHSTHVAGTMIGTGSVVGGQAKGMAPLATLNAYNFQSDEPEMTVEAANGMLISNHSYGIPTINPTTGVPVQLFYAGYYDSNARNMDRIIYNAPFYLPIVAAGNDRGNGFNSADGGYDILTDKSIAKNNMVVAAVFEVLDYTGPSSVNMSSFSSWGPTDDGRIKPDISAKGVAMLSSTGNSNSSFGNLSGTSMATPNVSGSLLLLQQHYNETNGEFMLASTVKALAINTADEAGTTPGPDYRFGWGLLNTERAAAMITNNNETSMIVEETLLPNQEYTTSFTANGIDNVFATLVWTDPPGQILPPGNEDDATPVLVNDLDIRISGDGGATWMPWLRDVNDFAGPAITGDNLVDTVEKIEMMTPDAGVYQVRISHKGEGLVDNQQVFSLVISGIADQEFVVSSADAFKQTCPEEGSVDFEIDVAIDEGVNESISFTVENLPAGVVALVSPLAITESGTVTLTLSNIEGLAEGEYDINVIATGTTGTYETPITLEIVDSFEISPVTLDFPPNNAQNRPVDITLTWEPTEIITENYVLEVATDEAFTNIIDTQTTPELFADVTGLMFSTQYYWRVRGTSTCGEGPFSEGRVFTTMDILSTDDNAIPGLIVYPNPTANMLNITAATTIKNVEIYNVLGQVVVSKEVNGDAAQVDMTGFNSGSYFVKITSQSSSSVIQVLRK